MQLDVKSVASLLNVSEKTVYRWISQGKAPVYRANEQYRFNRAELLEWATREHLNASVDLLREPEGLFQQRAGFHTHTGDVFRSRIFTPLFRLVERIAFRLRPSQHGRIRIHALYLAVTLLILLVWKLR